MPTLLSHSRFGYLCITVLTGISLLLSMASDGKLPGPLFRRLESRLLLAPSSLTLLAWVGGTWVISRNGIRGWRLLNSLRTQGGLCDGGGGMYGGGRSLLDLKKELLSSKL